MPLSDLEQSLQNLNDAFKEASTDSDPYALPEPGVYQAVVRAIDFFEAKNPPNDAYLAIKMEIVFDAKYAGRNVDIVHGLEPHLRFDSERVQQKLGFLKKDLATLGIDVEADDFSLAQVRPGAEMWDGVLDAPVELAVVDSKKINDKTGKPYRNVYLNQRLGEALGSDLTPKGAAPAAPTYADTDDVPF